MTRRVLVMFAVLAVIALGLALYALHLKRKVARDEQLAAQQQQPLAPPSNGPPTPVTLYIASDSDGTLRRTQVNVTLPPERSERARAVLACALRTVLAVFVAPSHRRRRGCPRRLLAGRRYRHSGHECRLR